MSELREALARVQTVIGRATRGAPETETAALVREVANRIEAFSLFECAGEMLSLRPGGSFHLDALLARAEAQGPYRSAFLKEGIGYLYAASELHRAARPEGMIARALASGAPAEALAPIHMGMGLCFAEHALRGARVGNLPDRVDWFQALWNGNAGAAWRPVGAEPLGFATRALMPAWTSAVGRLVAGRDSNARGY
jgi:hypothetical protein